MRPHKIEGDVYCLEVGIAKVFRWAEILSLS